MLFRRIIFIALLLASLSLPRLALAADTPVPTTTFTPEISIPGFSGARNVDENLFPDYLNALYEYFLGVVGVLAVVMIMYGGFRWITAAGNASRIGEAKQIIQSAVIGVILALTSFIILRTINPNLVKLKIPLIDAVKQKLQQQSSFCNIIGGNAAEKAGETPCGQEVTYTDSAGATQVCTASFCLQTGTYNADNSASPNTPVCGYNKKLDAFKCEKVKDFCSNHDYNTGSSCKAADAIVANLEGRLVVHGGKDETPKGVHDSESPYWDLACGVAYYLGTSNDECRLGRIITCDNEDGFSSPEGGCNFNHGNDSPCWKDNGPLLGCSDDPRTSVGEPHGLIPSICCVKKEKKDILCADSIPRASRLGQGYVEIPCSSYDGTGNYQDGSNTCDKKCFMLAERKGQQD